MIGDENSVSPSSFRGYGGKKFIILFDNGGRIITTNLWHQGTIPKWFEEYLPDNAVFEEGEPWIVNA